MGAQDAARTVSVTAAANFSKDARVNAELMATPGLVVRMNCYEPGQVTPMHMHPEEDEVLYVVEGDGKVIFERMPEVRVKTGDLVCLPGDQFHSIVNDSAGRMTLIYFMKPDYRSVRPQDGAAHPVIAKLHGERGA
ncbi:MAG: cupin domain-containing protein [Alphaproteobacteria bacterium]